MHEEITTTHTTEVVEHATAVEVVEHGAAEHETGAHAGELKHESTLYAEPIFHIGSFAVTNAVITGWIAVLIIVALSIALRLSMKKVPGRLQHFFEYVIEGGLSLADQVTGKRAISEKVFPTAISIFFFVLVSNWLGLLPLGGFGIIEHGTFVPIIRSATADVNTTVMLAIVAVIASNIFGAVIVGIWKAFNKYVNLRVLGSIVTKVRKDPTIIAMAPVMFFVGLIEIIGEMSKVASLSFRLFGNVFAGEVLLASMSALMAVGVPIPFMFLEIMVGFIQALIFAMLTMVYFTIAAEDHDSHDEEHGHAEGEHSHA